MGLNWLLKETLKSDPGYVQMNVSNLSGKYKTQAIMIDRDKLDLNRQYIIEVWFNFQSGKHVLNIYKEQIEGEI